MKSNRMYEDVKPWNIFVGCKFNCIYCKPSFQAQAKRQKHNCLKCYNFEPHEHPDRLCKVPKAKIVWPCSSGDISFASHEYITKIIHKISCHVNHTFYLQSKNPRIFDNYLSIMNRYNTVLLTTLETNRDKDYNKISKAPYPTDRVYDFIKLQWPRKIVTIEPIMKFDHNEFLQMITEINPEMVYLGYNSRPKQVQLPEPLREETEELIDSLKCHNIKVKTKYLPW